MSKYSKDYLDPEKGAKLWKERFALAESNQAKQFKRFSNWYDALYAQVGVIPSPWRSKVYVPVLARQTWSLIAKFLTLKPGFEVRIADDSIGNEEPQQRAEKAQRKLEHDYENPYLDESIRDKLFAPLLDAAVTGTGLAKVPWTVKSYKKYSRIIDENGYADLTKEKVAKKITSYNDLDPVNIFNVYPSPSATGVYYPKCPWLIIKDPNKLVSELEDINKSKGVEVYKNLNKLTGKVSTDNNAQYNRSRNRLLTNADGTDKTVKQVVLYECYENDKICTYAEDGDGAKNEGWVLIREQRNPYWHGKYPLVRFVVKKKPFSFWGEGLFEITYRLQAAYNDAFNHFMDQWNLSENSMIFAHENSNINQYTVEPGGVVTWRGAIKPEQFKHAEPNPEQLQVILGLIDQAIEGVTVSQYASGLPNSNTDKTKGTATGILRLQEAAGDIVSFFRANFTQSILQVGRMWLSNNQQYMQEPLTVMGTGKNKMQPMTITPGDLQGELELVIDDASMQPPSKEEQRANFEAFTASNLQLQAASFTQAEQIGTQPLVFNFTELAEENAEQYGIKNMQSALMSDQEVQKLQAEQAQTAMQQMMQAEQQAAQEQAAMQQEQVAVDEQADIAPGAPNPEADAEVSAMVDELSASGNLDPEVAGLVSGGARVRR